MNEGKVVKELKRKLLILRAEEGTKKQQKQIRHRLRKLGIYTFTPKQRDNIRQSRMGAKHSEDTKAKMSKTQRKLAAERRKQLRKQLKGGG